MTEILHINDNNLLLQNQERVIRSQGYAWFKGSELVFDLGDEKPIKHCRLSPQQINNRYWQQCEQSAIPANAPGMRHAADLIWKHLGELKQQHSLNQVCLVVPSHYREANLQLLLGISKASGLDVVGLANKAVVALHGQGLSDGSYSHIDVQLHQTVCSNILVENGVAKLGEIDVLSDVGIHLMQEALLKGLQSNFIQNDRFDPLHDAATEQQLFDQLSNIAKSINESGKASVGLEHQGRLYNTVVDDKEWKALLNDFSSRIIAHGQSAHKCFVDLNSAFDGVGLKDLEGGNCASISGVPTIAVEALIQADQSSGIIYKTDFSLSNSTHAGASTQEQSLPASVDASAKFSTNDAANNVSSKASTSKVTTAVSNQASATHLLQAGVAVPIERALVKFEQGLLKLESANTSNLQDLLTQSKVLVLNDEGRTDLLANDRIGSNLAEGVISVIQVFG